MLIPGPYRYKGQSYPSLWALGKACRISHITLKRRLLAGLSLKEATTIKSLPVGEKPIKVGKQTFPSIIAAIRHYGLSRECVYRRLHNGWSVNDAFGLSKKVEERNGYVYLIKNTVNDKVYVGITVNKPALRFASHKSNATCEKDTKLHVAMRRLGMENFYMKVVKHGKTPSELRVLEKVFIKKYDSIANGYNVKNGGGTFGNCAGTSVKIGHTTYKSIMAAAAATGIKHGTIRGRMANNTKIDAPVVPGRNGLTIKHDSQTFSSYKQLADHLGMSAAALSARLKRGQSLYDSIRPSTNPNGRRGIYA